MLFLAGCAGGLPRVLPGPFVSPLGRPGEQRLYVPYVAYTPNGLGMAGCPASCEAFGCGWCYSWGPQPTAGPGIETVPMIWDEKQVDMPIAGNSQWIMGFNEPDQASQANLTPEQAVDGWLVLEARFPDRKLVSLSVTCYGWDWWQQWLAAFQARTGRLPRMDAIAIHVLLDPGLAAPWIERWLAEAERLGVPEVWITETIQRDEAAAHWLLAYVAAEPRITKVAIYVSKQDCDDGTWDCTLLDPSLVAPDGQTLTEMGRWWAQPWER